MGYDQADKNRNEKINAEQKSKLNEEIKELSNDIKFLKSLVNVKKSEAWKESGDFLLKDFVDKSFKELTEEYTRIDGKAVKVEPGELLIRQRVFNRVRSFMYNFDAAEKKLQECLEKMEALEKEKTLLDEATV